MTDDLIKQVAKMKPGLGRFIFLCKHDWAFAVTSVGGLIAIPFLIYEYIWKVFFQ